MQVYRTYFETYKRLICSTKIAYIAKITLFLLTKEENVIMWFYKNNVAIPLTKRAKLSGKTGYLEIHKGH